jgi:hypothetical protein
MYGRQEGLLMSKKIKLKVGDLFRFRVSDAEFGFGQIVLSKILQYIVIYEPIFSGVDDIAKIPQSRILLSGWTNDARFFSGDWAVVANMPLSQEVVFPEYKVGTGQDCRITDVNGKILRAATQAEEHRLQFKTTHSPIIYEKAFHAHHFGGWESRFDNLVLDRAR